MNRIDKCFEELKAAGKKALITFITAGDPDLETTEKLVLEMYDKGADIIELGVPFSDPVAEGVTIQKASLRSLSGGTNLTKIFDTVKNIRCIHRSSSMRNNNELRILCQIMQIFCKTLNIGIIQRRFDLIQKAER